MEYLVVDGYNVINAWSDIFNLNKESYEDCRDKLLNMLSNFQGYKKINIIVVFDAYNVKGGQENIENYDNITVVYTKENETADNYIERFVYRMAKDNRIYVVTSDYLEQRTILHGGGARMSPRELKEEIVNASSGPLKREKEKKHHKTNTIMANVSKELLDKLEKMRRGNM